MSGAHVSIEVDGKPEFDRTFSRLDANFDDLTPIWPAVRAKFYEIEAQQFDSEGGKGGSGRWKALSARYAAQKVARYGDKPILEATGDLRASLTSDGAGSYYWADKQEVAIGTTLPYAMYHQRGSGKLPERKPISFSDEQTRDLMKTIQSELVKQLRSGRYYVPLSDRFPTK
jgi:phage gpG-like protein